MRAELIRDYRVADFMSRDVATVGIDTPVESAIKTMVERGIGSVVVVSPSGPVGVMTERDLLQALGKGDSVERIEVGEIMDAVVSRVRSDAGSKAAAQAMTEARGRLLAVDGGRVAGIVTASDIVRVVWRLGADFGISDVVSKKVIAVDAWTTVAEAVKTMDKRGVGSVIIEVEGNPMGMFTERDLLNRVLYPGLTLDKPVTAAWTVPLVSAPLRISGWQAVDAMVGRRVKRLPLMREGKLVGIVTARDIVEGYAYGTRPRKSEVDSETSVRYGEVCTICNSRIDDEGLCSCGTIGGD